MRSRRRFEYVIHQQSLTPFFSCFSSFLKFWGYSCDVTIVGTRIVVGHATTCAPLQTSAAAAPAFASSVAIVF